MSDWMRRQPSGRMARMWLIPAAACLIAAALGAWDVFVERDGGESLWRQIVYPLVLGVCFLGLSRRVPRDAARAAADARAR